MAIRIEWDEFEIALLIEACEEVLRKGKPKSEVVKTVSSNLRKRAISKNIAIDDVFRNENGIALQMQKMAYLLTHGEKGMPGASKLYAEVAELREENPKKFEEILKRAMMTGYSFYGEDGEQCSCSKNFWQEIEYSEAREVPQINNEIPVCFNLQKNQHLFSSLEMDE